MTVDPPALTLATAGHVDHGKTALVAALTGHDTDRLAEERARGISIELGFAPLDVADRRVSLIDVPGHERFVRHMVAGASGVDGYLLCVAADDGVMPQTREHLAVLDLLDVRDGVVAITKSALADPGSATAQVREMVAARVAIVPVDSLTGDGIPDLRDALARLVAGLARRVGGGPSRLFVDRSFSVAGAGTVVTGTLWGDPIAAGTRVRVHPGDHPARVRTIQAHDRSVDRAEGGRVALALAGLDRDRAARGSVVVRDGEDWTPTTLLDVALTWARDAGAPLRTRRVVQAFLGTAETSAMCILLDATEIEPGQRAYAQLRLGAPVVAAPGDRLVLRSAERRTVGGARVVDPAPQRHGRGSGAAARLLVLDRGDADEVAELRLRESGPEGHAIGHEAVPAGARILAGRAYPLDRVHDVADHIVGMAAGDGSPRATVVAACALARDAADALIDELVAAGRVVDRAGRLVRSDGAAPDSAAAALLALLAERGLRPPTRDEMLAVTKGDAGALDVALASLRRDGSAVSAGDLWFARSAADDAVARAVERLRESPLGIGDLRDLWGVGRRQALALAAHMDASGLTLRRGDVRVLRRSARGGT